VDRRPIGFHVRREPMIQTEVIDDLAVAEALTGAWDELAVAASLPLCAPGWMLPWWRHVAPAGGELCIVAIRDGQRLIALAPWFSHRGHGSRVDLRFLGAELSDRVDVLCLPGYEQQARAELLGALAKMRPRPDLVAFEAVPVGSIWSRSLARGNPRLARYRNSVLPAPTVTLPAGEPEAWLAGRSSNFRSQMKRMRRRLHERGGLVRQIVEPDLLGPAIDSLLKLHESRWENRGSSGLVRPEVREFLREAASTLGPDRLRLWAVEIDGTPISIQLFQAAGGEIKYWNGGWAEQHGDLKPTMLTILAALEDAIGRGEHRLDLGAGTHTYKMRFADGEDPLSWGGLIVRNCRWPATRAELAPQVLRYRAKLLVRSLPAPAAARLETIVKRADTAGES
jgi:CelD/BcsL family acetyltransferase involved in cellulose biosynthesis